MIRKKNHSATFRLDTLTRSQLDALNHSLNLTSSELVRKAIRLIYKLHELEEENGGEIVFETDQGRTRLLLSI